MQKIADWLEKLGMSEYAERFAENDIDASVLPHLTDQSLKELGVSLGHRLKILAATRDLGGPTPVAPEPVVAPAEPKSKDTAERRQVTVMFSDLVGSTALSGRMDPEDLREVISAYQKCVAQTVQRCGGYVAKFMGDGVLIFFGYPQAHEDDAERAVRAALQLVAAVGDLKTAQAPLQTRVGIATGLVVVGDVIGSGEAQERGIVGETPNLAARLQGLAEPNSVVIAESTRKLLGNLFELEDLGARDLKGIAEPVHAWAALRPSGAESRFEAFHASGLTDLVGREEELDLLLRRWTKAKTGEGQVVLLSGEAGIGKSRLTAALLENIAAEPHARLRYFCSPQHTDSALYPIISQTERAAGLTHNDPLAAKLDKLDVVLARTSTSKQDAALLADMLSLPNDGRYVALDLAPEQRRQRTLQALVSQMEALARQNPVLMVFEDAHWTDPTSLELFGRVVDRIKSLSALLIMTFRPEFDAPWIGRPYVTALTINRLAQRDIEAMIDRVVGNKPIPAGVRKDIIERTDGIPLFVEEMTKAVLEAGSEEEAQWTAATVPSTALAVPASLHASLMARLDRLGAAKEVAQIGAAIGREFSHALLAAVVRKPEGELQSALDRLVATGLLFCQGVPPQASYLFKHALVQDAAYSTLLRARRQQLNGRIVTILEKQFPEVVNAQPALIAHHSTEAALSEKAVGYWLQAGQHAVSRSAMTEAVAQLQKGLDLLKSMPDTSARQQQELDLRITLGQALIATKGYASPLVGETYVRARLLAEQLDRSDDLLPLLYGQVAFHHVRGELKLALSLGEQMEKIGQARGDASFMLMGRTVYGIMSLHAGEFVAARNAFAQCYLMNDPTSRAANRAACAAVTAEDPHVVILVHTAVNLAYLGHIDQARSWIKEAFAEADQLGHVYSLAMVSVWASWVECVAGSQRDMRRHAEQAVSLSTEHGFSYLLAWGLFYRGWSMASLGESEEGYGLIAKGLALHRASGAVTSQACALTFLAEACIRLGRTTEGLGYLTEAEQLIETTNDAFHEAELYRVRGDLLNTIGDLAGVECSYQHAIAVAKRQSSKMFELRAATGLARLWRDQGKRDEARNLLAPVYGWFTEGFDTLDLKEAKNLLGELSS